MTRQVLYVAAPLAPSEEEIEQVRLRIGKWNPGVGFAGPGSCAKAATLENAKRAMRWLSWLRRSFPETTFIAPWIASVLGGEDDTDPAQREAGLVDACAVVERCDGIVLCGPRISSGMRREMEHGRSHSNVVMDNLICHAPGEPLPFIGPIPNPFHMWAGLFREDQ